MAHCRFTILYLPTSVPSSSTGPGPSITLGSNLGQSSGSNLAPYAGPNLGPNSGMPFRRFPPSTLPSTLAYPSSGSPRQWSFSGASSSNTSSSSGTASNISPMAAAFNRFMNHASGAMPGKIICCDVYIFFLGKYISA